MLPLRFTLTCCILLSSAIATRIEAANFELSNASITVGVTRGFPDIDGDGNANLTLPYNATHSAAIAPSSITANYDLSNTRFLIDFIMASQATFTQTTSVSASSFNDITPAEDILVQYDGRFDFDLPADSMTAVLDFAVFESDDNTVILASEDRSHNTIFGIGPRTFEISGEFILPAGNTWLMGYLFRITSRSSSAPFTGTGGGYLDVRFIPEPHTALLLLFGTAAANHRRPWRGAIACDQRAPFPPTP